MAELDDSPFDAVRHAADAASIPPAAEIRSLGDRRTRRTRVLLATTTLLLVVGGAGAAMAVTGGGSDTLEPPAVTGVGVTTAPAPTPSPAAPPSAATLTSTAVPPTTPPSLAVSVPPAAKPATKVTLAGPVDAAGRLRSGFRVTATVPADLCNAGSETVGRTYRCFTTHFVYDPCWPSAVPTELFCVGDPWTRSVTRLVLAQPAEAIASDDPASTDEWPWGLELAGGVRCTELQGAHGSFHDRTVDFSCSDGTWVLRGLDRTAATWQADRTRNTSSGDQVAAPSAAVLVAYVGRPS